MPWRDRFLGVAAFLARHAHLLTPYVEEVAAGDRERSDDVVLAGISTALADAVADGDLHDHDGSIPVADLAHTVMVVLVTRLLARPSGGAEGAVAWVEQVVLAGLLPSAALPGQESNLRR